MKKLQLAVDERNVRRTLKIKYEMLKGKADLGHRVLYMHSSGFPGANTTFKH